MNKIFIKIGAVVAYVAMVALNYIAVLLPLGGRGTGEISDSYPNLFAPAGYAFSIWGLIYTLLAIYVVYQFIQKENALTERISRLFILNALFNGAWIFAWHYDVIWLSVLIMFGLLITLIKIADILRGQKMSQKERFFVRLPFSVYFGWITVATIANITILLVALNWNGFGISDVFWTVLVLLVGAGIGLLRMLLDRNIPYALVLLWAYGGILSKHLSKNAFDGQYPAIIATVAICMIIFIGSILYVAIRHRDSKQIIK